MEQSLLLTLHERFERVGNDGVYTDYTIQDMKQGLPNRLVTKQTLCHSERSEESFENHLASGLKDPSLRSG